MFNLPEISTNYSELFEETATAVCGPDCEFRWGDNCASHWKDENDPQEIQTSEELRDILYQLPWESWDVMFNVVKETFEIHFDLSPRVLLVTEEQLSDLGIHPHHFEYLEGTICPRHVKKKFHQGCSCWLSRTYKVAVPNFRDNQYAGIYSGL